MYFQVAESNLPSVQEVCDQLGLVDVEIPFEDDDYQTLQTYKQFQQHVRPILQKENPKIAVSKLMMLVAAKWRDFEADNPYLEQPDEDKSKTETTVDTSRADEEYDDEDDEDSKSSSKKSRRSSRKAGKSKSKSSKVPTLKIRIGKRKRGSSVWF